jgi:hypothetical protein
MIRARKSGSGKPRGIEARIAQLEGLHRSRDEILVVWRRPGAAVSKALSKVHYGPGDRVVCFEWFGSGAPPQPQWRSDLRDNLSKGGERLDRYYASAHYRCEAWPGPRRSTKGLWPEIIASLLSIVIGGYLVWRPFGSVISLTLGLCIFCGAGPIAAHSRHRAPRCACNLGLGTSKQRH